MNNKWLYLPIETETRELSSKVLIAIEAIKRDYNVVIGNTKVIKFLNILPKGVFLSKDSDGLVYETFKNYRKNGGFISVHDEEGFVQFNDEKYISTRLDFPTLGEIDSYLCWGDHQKNVIDKFKVKYNKDMYTVSTGHPRIDLLTLNKNKENKKFDRILINTKLSACNIKGKDKGNSYIKLLNSHNMIKSEEDLKFFNNYVIYEQKLFDKYVNLIKELSLKFIDKEIMIRPHPGEEENTWIELFKDYKNVIVEKSNSINYWIERSDLIIHTGCTTGIESTILGKYTIAYKPINDDNYDIRLPNDVSHCVEYTLDDLLKNVEKFYGDFKSFIDYHDNKILLENITINDSPSYVKIVDEIDKLSLKKGDLSLYSKILLGIRKSINKNKKWTNTKMKRYDEEKFSIYINELLEKYDIKKQDYSIKELDTNLFLLSKSFRD